MSNVKHTPTPWKVRPFDLEQAATVVAGADETWVGQSWAIVGAGSDRTVAEFGFSTHTKADWSYVKDLNQAKANMAFALRAVNMHDALVKMLDEVTSELEFWQATGQHGPNACAMTEFARAVIERARAA